MSLVTWQPWQVWGAPATTPGVIATAGAICLVIIVGNEDKTIESLDWKTLVYMAAFRYTTQVLSRHTTVF